MVYRSAFTKAPQQAKPTDTKQNCCNPCDCCEAAAEREDVLLYGLAFELETLQDSIGKVQADLLNSPHECCQVIYQTEEETLTKEAAEHSSVVLALQTENVRLRDQVAKLKKLIPDAKAERSKALTKHQSNMHRDVRSRSGPETQDIPNNGLLERLRRLDSGPLEPLFPATAGHFRS